MCNVSRRNFIYIFRKSLHYRERDTRTIAYDNVCKETITRFVKVGWIEDSAIELIRFEYF